MGVEKESTKTEIADVEKTAAKPSDEKSNEAAASKGATKTAEGEVKAVTDGVKPESVIETEKKADIPQVNDDRCKVCGEDWSAEDNEIVFCDGCNLSVHQFCYGGFEIPEGSWLCDPCRANDKNPTCVICMKKGGGFRMSVKHGWCHICCVTHLPETRFADEGKCEGILGIDRIDRERYKLKCVVCGERKGACHQCTYSRCCTSFHVSCALLPNSGCLVLTNFDDGSGMLDNRALCSKHKDKEYRVSKVPAKPPAYTDELDEMDLIEDDGGIPRAVRQHQRFLELEAARKEREAQARHEAELAAHYAQQEGPDSLTELHDKKKNMTREILLSLYLPTPIEHLPSGLSILAIVAANQVGIPVMSSDQAKKIRVKGQNFTDEQLIARQLQNEIQSGKVHPSVIYSIPIANPTIYDDDPDVEQNDKEQKIEYVTEVEEVRHAVQEMIDDLTDNTAHDPDNLEPICALADRSRTGGIPQFVTLREDEGPSLIKTKPSLAAYRFPAIPVASNKRKHDLDKVLDENAADLAQLHALHQLETPSESQSKRARELEDTISKRLAALVGQVPPASVHDAAPRLSVARTGFGIGPHRDQSRTDRASLGKFNLF